jgi:alpha-L-rhamnosidase
MRVKRLRVLIATAGLCSALAGGMAQSRPAGGTAVAATADAAWTASWIQAPWSTERDGAELDGSRPMPLFRRQFVVRGKAATADVRIAGLGQYVLSVDGKLVSPVGLHQAWTDYRKTVTYDSYVLKLTPGEHVLGVMLGNGMYNVQRTKGRYTKFEGSFGPPKLSAEMVVHSAGGRVKTSTRGSCRRVGTGRPLTTRGGSLRRRWMGPAEGWSVPFLRTCVWCSVLRPRR